MSNQVYSNSKYQYTQESLKPSIFTLSAPFALTGSLQLVPWNHQVNQEVAEEAPNISLVTPGTVITNNKGMYNISFNYQITVTGDHDYPIILQANSGAVAPFISQQTYNPLGGSVMNLQVNYTQYLPVGTTISTYITVSDLFSETLAIDTTILSSLIIARLGD